jgi:3-methyladenine DNA glycosylase AlkD
VISTKDLGSFIKHESIWGQRLAIVSLVLPLRKGFGDMDRHLKIISLYNGRKEKMITKAVSWALREGSKSHPEKIRAFIDRYARNLRGSTVREVRNKLERGVKR